MANRTKLTPEIKKLFIELLTECGNVSKSIQTAANGRISRTCLYEHKATDKEFSDAWEKAASIGALGLEDEARRRAFEGVNKPIYYKGELVDTVKEYSDNLLQFMIKAHSPTPEKYAERKTHDIGPGLADSLEGRLTKALNKADGNKDPENNGSGTNNGTGE